MIAESKTLNTAVLFLIFNRPDTTQQVFEVIRKVKPPRLYIASDGPREDRAGELLKVEEAREVVASVDWPCEVRTLYQEENLGCKYAVSGAIDWFFENEEMGIVIEAPARTLSSILDDFRGREVDFMSLDLEGYEVNALQGIDFERHRPRYLLIEVRDRAEIDNVIGRYYDCVATLSENERHSDLLYKRRVAEGVSS